MTFARPVFDRVRITFPLYDVDQYIKPMTLLAEAQDRRKAVEGDLPTYDLRPFDEALTAAEDDVEDLFREDLTIEQAERLLADLHAAIIHAKASDGRFNGDR